jgi:hypothetical protein
MKINCLLRSKLVSIDCQFNDSFIYVFGKIMSIKIPPFYLLGFLWLGFIPYPYAAGQDDGIEKEFKLCMNSCRSNSCSGPASVVEKNCLKRCIDQASSTNASASHPSKKPEPKLGQAETFTPFQNATRPRISSACGFGSA